MFFLKKSYKYCGGWLNLYVWDIEQAIFAVNLNLSFFKLPLIKFFNFLWMTGIIISILRIITKASLPQTPKGLQTSAHLYFIVSTIFLLCCIIFSNLQYKLPVMLHHHQSLLHEENSCSSGPKFWAVAGKIRWPAFGILVIYIVTLSIFPGFIAEDLVSEFFKDWYPILLISVYNIADLIGKCLTAFYVVKSFKTATWCSICRLVFYPLFIFCLHGPKWLKTEVPIMVLTFALGLTNGYLTSVLMIVAPKSVALPESELSAIVMILFLGFGLAGGSVLGWFWIVWDLSFAGPTKEMAR